MPELDAENYAEGNVGYLTYEQFDRLRRAVHNAHKHVGWWRVAGYIRLGDSDEHRTRQKDLPLGVPATWLAAEEVSRLLRELNWWPELEDAANDVDGSELAMLLVREVETAMHKWPLEDRPHRVRYFRCTACQQVSLRYYPPTVLNGELVDTVVKCTDKQCRAVVDAGMFERMAVIVEQEHRERAERAKRLDSGKGRTGEGGPVEGYGVPVGAPGQGEVLASGEGVVAESVGSVGG